MSNFRFTPKADSIRKLQQVRKVPTRDVCARLTICPLQPEADVLRGTRFAGTPDLRWRSPINLSEHRIESPQATEACAHGDLRHREIGLVQKPLRPLHACRLGDLNRACTEVHLEEPGQMSRTDPETIGQSLDTAVIKCTVRDDPKRTFDSGACSLPCRRERSSLRPAPQTRSETRKFGRRCRRIEHYGA